MVLEHHLLTQVPCSQQTFISHSLSKFPALAESFDTKALAKGDTQQFVVGFVKGSIVAHCYDKNGFRYVRMLAGERACSHNQCSSHRSNTGEFPGFTMSVKQYDSKNVAGIECSAGPAKAVSVPSTLPSGHNTCCERLQCTATRLFGRTGGFLFCCE